MAIPGQKYQQVGDATTDMNVPLDALSLPKVVAVTERHADVCETEHPTYLVDINRMRDVQQNLAEVLDACVIAQKEYYRNRPCFGDEDYMTKNEALMENLSSTKHGCEIQVNSVTLSDDVDSEWVQSDQSSYYVDPPAFVEAVIDIWCG